MNFTLEQFEQIPLSSARIFTTPRGEGPLLLFVHGGFHGAWCFSDMLGFLARQGVPCAALDLTGHGGLVPPIDFAGRGVVHMAGDVAEAAALLGGPIVLAGHSLGALTVMAAAREVRPVGMVLLAPAPPANVSVRLLPPFPEDGLVAPPPPERVRRWFFSAATEIDAGAYAARLCPESPAFLNDVYRRNIIVDPAWTAGPALCLSGGKDNSPLHLAGQDEAVAEFYGAELRVLPGVGHCFMYGESHAAASASLLEWLRLQDLAGSLPPDDGIAS